MNNGLFKTKYYYKRTEIFLFIANEEELKAFNTFIESHNIIISSTITINKYQVKLFRYNNYHIAMTCPMSTGGRGASDVLHNVANEFPNLQYVVNIGCCATTSRKVKNEVVFADKVFDADLRKEKKNGTEYAIGENKHSTLSNRIKLNIELLSGKDYSLVLEPMISSSAVIKNKITKKQYVKAYPYASGIEMEGLAISDYALMRNIEWMVIKGTSDNGIRKKGGHNQKKATINAFDVFFKILNNKLLPLERVKVFVSGAVESDLEKNNHDLYLEVETNSYLLGESLLKNNYKIINGLGYGVGFGLVSSAYSYHRNDTSDPFSTFMEVFPFPRTKDVKKKESVRAFYQENRNNMINQCLLSLFVYGRNTDVNQYNGMIDEFNIAGGYYLPRIVLPTEGFISNRLYETAMDSLPKDIGDSLVVEIYRSIGNNKNNFSEQIKIAILLLGSLDNMFYGGKE